MLHRDGSTWSDRGLAAVVLALVVTVGVFLAPGSHAQNLGIRMGVPLSSHAVAADLPDAAMPPAHWNHSVPYAVENPLLAWDPAGPYLVSVGVAFPGGIGVGSPYANPESAYNQTWVYEAGGWSQLATPASLPQYSSMTYDPADGYVLLYGVSSETSNVSETWALTNGSWENLQPAVSPPPRTGGALAYDSSTGSCILFGGQTTNLTPTGLNDTWSFRHGAWSLLHPTVSPGLLSYAALADDPVHGGLVLYGGWGWSPGNPYADNAQGETWLFQGGSWSVTAQSSGSPGTTPPREALSAMAFDPATGDLVLVGGTDWSGGGQSSTWSLNGSRWTELNTSVDSLTNFLPGLAWDSVDQELLRFGGTDPGVYALENGRWTYTGGNPQFDEGEVAFDASDGYVMGVSYDAVTSVDDTYWLNGTQWERVPLHLAPAYRQSFVLAYDAEDGYVVLYGGWNVTNASYSFVYNDTWVYHASQWTELLPTRSPPSMGPDEMAYDPSLGSLVLVGSPLGVGGESPPGVQTWLFRGGDWSPLPSGPEPSWGDGGNDEDQLSYDAADGWLVLLGVGGGPWVLQSSTWLELTTGRGPPPVAQVSFGYDPSSGVSLLFGGYNETVPGEYPPSQLDGLWAFLGGAWTRLTSQNGPPGISGATFLFDPSTDEMVLIGGWNVTYDSENAATVTSEHIWTVRPGAWPIRPYPAIFRQTGLPDGLNWSVSTPNQVAASTTSWLSMALENGSYPFSVVAPPGYVSEPGGGVIDVAGGPAIRNVTFESVPPELLSFPAVQEALAGGGFVAVLAALIFLGRRRSKRRGALQLEGGRSTSSGIELRYTRAEEAEAEAARQRWLAQDAKRGGPKP